MQVSRESRERVSVDALGDSSCDRVKTACPFTDEASVMHLLPK